MTSPSTKTTVVLVGALLLTAGCLQSGTGTGSSTIPPSSSPSPSPLPSPPPSSATHSPTSTGTTTDEPIGTGDIPWDLSVSNWRDRNVSLKTTIVSNASGETVFDRTLQLASHDKRSFDVHFPEAGNYTITTRDTEGDVYRYVWHIEHVPPGGVLAVFAKRDGTVTYSVTWA